VKDGSAIVNMAVFRLSNMAFHPLPITPFHITTILKENALCL
jgi:hypothetical protein